MWLSQLMGLAFTALGSIAVAKSKEVFFVFDSGTAIVLLVWFGGDGDLAEKDGQTIFVGDEDLFSEVSLLAQFPRRDATIRY